MSEGRVEKVRQQAKEADWFDAALEALDAIGPDFGDEDAEEAASDHRFASYDKTLADIRIVWEALMGETFDDRSPVEDVINAIYFAGWAAGAQFAKGLKVSEPA